MFNHQLHSLPLIPPEKERDRDWERPCFVAFGVNTPTIVDFRLPTWHQLIAEFLKISHWLGWAGPSTPLGCFKMVQFYLWDWLGPVSRGHAACAVPIGQFFLNAQLYCLESLNNVWTRGITFLFCTGPTNYVAWPPQRMRTCCCSAQQWKGGQRGKHGETCHLFLTTWS